MFVRHCRVWPAMSGAAHSPAFPPGRMGAWAEMKTSPFATTQWEYGPRGFGCFGRSGTAFTIVHFGNVRATKNVSAPGGGRFPPSPPGSIHARAYYIPTAFSGEPRGPEEPRRGIPDGQERPRLPHWRRRRGWRVIYRREIREDVRAERAPHLDVLVLPERHPRRPRLDPDPRQPRSRALPWARPGCRHRAEPAVDGRPPGGRRRGRGDRLRHGWHATGSRQVAPERAAHRYPAAEEGPDALAERAHAKHGRPRRGRQAVRHRLSTRRERLQGHLGGQETGDRAAEHRRDEPRRVGGRPVDRAADEDGTRRAEHRVRRRTRRLAACDRSGAESGGVFPAVCSGVQPRRDLSDADQPHLRPVSRRRLPDRREAGLQRADRA